MAFKTESNFEQSKLRRSPSFTFSKSIQRPLSPTLGSNMTDWTPSRTVMTNSTWNRPITASSTRPTTSKSTTALLSTRNTYMGSSKERPNAMTLLKLKKLTTDTIESLVRAIDSDESGTIEYEEFVSALLNRMQYARKQAKSNASEKRFGRRSTT